MLYAWYHNEPLNLCPSRLTAPRIGAMRSLDDGANWEDLGIVLEAPGEIDCGSLNPSFAGGNGDFAVLPDGDREHLYFYFTSYGGAPEVQGIGAARMRFADRDRPVGKVWKWHAGSWSEPGLGGTLTPVLGVEGDWMRGFSSAAPRIGKPTSMRRTEALAAALGALLLAQPPASALTVGYNQAWIAGKWAGDLTARFDESDWRRVFRLAKDNGGAVVRVWLLEGEPMEGVVWDVHRPVGVEPSMLDAVRRIGALAEEAGVRVYWTLNDGNTWSRPGTLEFDRAYNVYNDKYGYGSEFRANVLGPLLDAIAEHPSAAFALDLVNEIEWSVKAGLFAGRWTGARRYLGRSAAFVHDRAPGLAVAASAGGESASLDIVLGRFDGLGLDAYDLHVYSDEGTIPWGRLVAAHARARGLPVMLGEIGQGASRRDDRLQHDAIRRLLREAERLGFSAALAWRLEDETGLGAKSLFDGDEPRAAVQAIRDAASRSGGG